MFLRPSEHFVRILLVPPVVHGRGARTLPPYCSYPNAGGGRNQVHSTPQEHGAWAKSKIHHVIELPAYMHSTHCIRERGMFRTLSYSSWWISHRTPPPPIDRTLRYIQADDDPLHRAQKNVGQKKTQKRPPAYPRQQRGWKRGEKREGKFWLGSRGDAFLRPVRTVCLATSYVENSKLFLLCHTNEKVCFVGGWYFPASWLVIYAVSLVPLRNSAYRIFLRPDQTTL